MHLTLSIYISDVLTLLIGAYASATSTQTKCRSPTISLPYIPPAMSGGSGNMALPGWQSVLCELLLLYSELIKTNLHACHSMEETC